MKRLVCYFSGWFEIDVEDVMLTDINNEESKIQSAKAWLEERGNINGLTLSEFDKAFSDATDGTLEQCDLYIENENGDTL